MSRYFGIPLRNGLPLGLGTVATLRNGGASGPANSATAWYFAALGLTGTPWADVSRTGLGTRVDSAGLVGFGPHNLLRHRNNFADAVWDKGTGGSIAGGIPDPDGGASASAYTWPSTTGSYAFLSQTVSSTSNLTHTQSIWLRRPAGSGSRCLRLVISDVTTSSANSANVIVTEEWQQFSFSRASTNATGSVGFGLNTASASPPAPGIAAGDVVHVFKAAGAVGPVTFDIPTTTAARYLPRITHDPVTLSAQGLLVEGQATNFFGRTEDLSATYWTKRASTTITANAIVAPDGTTTADAINQITNGSGNGISQDGALWIVGRVAQFWVKAGAATSIIGQNGAGQQFTINTVTRAFESVNAAYSEPRVTPYPNGWLLCSIKNASGAGTDFFLGAAAGSGSGATFYVWGTQAAADASSYIPNPGTGSAVRVADWTGPGVALTGAALAAAFPGGVTGPFTGVIKYRKGYSVATDETLLALSAGSTAGGTNLFAVQTNGTQAKLTTSAGDGTATGTLVHDGSTVNRIAYSVDPTYLGPELANAALLDKRAATSGTVTRAAGVITFENATSGLSTGISQQITGLTIGRAYKFVGRGRRISGGINLVVQLRDGSGGGGSDVTPATTVITGTDWATITIVWTATLTSVHLTYVMGNSSVFEVDEASHSFRETGKMSISVNGSASVETTGIAYTGAGVAALIPGSQTYGGTEPLGVAVIDAWDNTRSTYITGSALQALTA